MPFERQHLALYAPASDEGERHDGPEVFRQVLEHALKLGLLEESLTDVALI
jgi:hypothetical protein